ncbi:MAG: NERD domain-containing protein [Bacteroidales bacterium]
MAIMRTDITGDETKGEKLMYYKFRDKLPDEYHIWHNHILHNKGREADFIICHPKEGVFVLEVKDWTIDQIQKIDSNRTQLIINGTTRNHENPIRQARKNWQALKNTFEKRNELRHQSGKYKDKLLFPINYGIVLTNISGSEIKRNNYESILPEKETITSDFIHAEYISEYEWETRLKDLKHVNFDICLDDKQWAALNSCLGTPTLKDICHEDMIGTLDAYQEKLMKYKIEKQIIIEGPAGSGKSIVLVKRAGYMKRMYPEWKIGVFCFNATMANYLRHLFKHEQFLDGIDIFDFYAFEKDATQKDFGPYDAILVDEGQDADNYQFQFYFSLLKNPKSSFTLFYDARQALYTKQKIRDLLQDIGFKIENEKELVKQQRSVLVLAALMYYKACKSPAKEFDEILKEAMSMGERLFHGFKSTFLSISNSVNRFFNNPHRGFTEVDFINELNERFYLLQYDSCREMIDDFCRRIEQKVSSGSASYSDFMIIYPHRNFNKESLPYEIYKKFQTYNIPGRVIDKGGWNCNGFVFKTPDYKTEWEYDNRRDSNLSENLVKIMTLHQSKGMDAKYVAIFGFESMCDESINKQSGNEILSTNQKNNEYFSQNCAELGYVALTRAKEECYVYYSIRNQLINILEKIKKGCN